MKLHKHILKYLEKNLTWLNLSDVKNVLKQLSKVSKVAVVTSKDKKRTKFSSKIWFKI